MSNIDEREHIMKSFTHQELCGMYLIALNRESEYKSLIKSAIWWIECSLEELEDLDEDDLQDTKELLRNLKQLSYTKGFNL